MRTFNYSDILNLEKRDRVQLITHITGPRSAHLIGTYNSDKTTNLAIFNTISHIGSNPPYLGFIMRPTTVERHTYNNIKSNGYFTVNQVHSEFYKKAHQTSAKYAEGVSEFKATGLTSEILESFEAPFVKESQIKIGLSFQEEQSIKCNNTILIIGRIEKIFLPESALSNQLILNHQNMDTICASGFDTYYTVQKMDQLDYARPKSI